MPPRTQKERFIALDALRGLAALAVVISHVGDMGGRGGSRLTRVLAEGMAQGRVGVVLFFVISGFCIHLRQAKARVAGTSTTIDFTSFWKQRFTRLYPPYLVAIGLYLAIQTWSGAIVWGGAAAYDLLMHGLMLHNLDARTVYSLDGVFWTLAIEEQLYLAYFLLMPLRDRLGWVRTLALCAAARVAWFGLAFVVGQWGGEFHLVHDAGSPAHWFTWALGAVAVEAALGLIRLPAWASRGWFAGLCFALAAGCDQATGRHLGGGIGWRLTWLVGSPLWGLGFFVLVNRLIQVEAVWRRAGLLPRPVTICAGVGLFSYSLYLTHNLVLKYLGPPLLDRLGLAHDLGGGLLLVAPALGLAWVFFHVCERPFLERAARLRSQVAVGPARPPGRSQWAAAGLPSRRIEPKSVRS